MDIRGAATGTEEMDVLRPEHITDRVHAVVLAGGSAFGLEAASGVRRFLEHRGVGFQTGAAVVPIVPCAILYDLGIGKPNVRPTREMGEAASAAATSEAVKSGALGVGTGATVGKIFGMPQAMKSGIGSVTVGLTDSVHVSALVAVNCFGFADTEAAMKLGAQRDWGRQNTTLAVVATNAKLSKVGATRLAEMANLGMARTIYPVNTSFDGDLCVALSLGNETAELNTLGVAAAEAVAKSILLAVRSAPSLGGVPGLAGPKKT